MSDMESFMRDLLNDVDKAKLVLYHDLKNIKELTEAVKNDIAKIAKSTNDMVNVIDNRTLILKDVQKSFKEDMNKTLQQFSSTIAGYQDTLSKYNQNIITLDKTITKLDNNIQNFKLWLIEMVNELKDIRVDVMSAKKTFADIRKMLIASLAMNGLLIIYIIYTFYAMKGGK